jgi:bifunctional UDP-N-acetylglucosamine pyrophosphorylase/glucosamine-1-phosphate N-acetyltransferase
MSLSIIILAAGKGTRMKSPLPKVLHAISGKPMLFHTIEAAQTISDDITVVLAHQAERIQATIEEHYDNIAIHLQDLTQFPGTGGALRGITPKHEKTLILNGDMPLITPHSLTQLTTSGATITMSVLQLENPHGYGRVVIEENQVQAIVEQKDCSEAQRAIQSVNAGIYCVNSDLLTTFIPQLSNDNAQQEYYLTDIIEMAVQEGKTITPIYVPEEEFKGVNSKYDLAMAEEMMQDRIKQHWMESGVTMHLPKTIYIEASVTFEGECEVEAGAYIMGNSHIADSTIKAHSVVESAILSHSSVGPMARIRPQSELNHTHIGNFVETKKSKLTGVKAGHLSYLGDATIDEGSNIGAGVITCNYDGKAKYQTHIGKNVFVGSDTQLVAPVTIESDVLIGAGSTITSDIKQGELALSRTPTKRVANFFYKFFGKKV